MTSNGVTEAASSPGAGTAGVSDGLHLATARGRWVLTATVLGSAMAQLDATVVGIAQPAIGKEFHAQISGLQWVSAGYLLTVAGLILLAGALTDRYGRRRIFVIGVTWFAIASLICAIAPNIGLLIAARGLQGVGGALLTPGSLAILEASFAPQERGRAIGAWSGLGGVATALGPFVGGFLITAVSWRLIFLINLPIAAAVIFIAMRHVPESRDPNATGYIDVAGSALTVVALVGISYGLIQGSSGNWASSVVLGALLIGVVAAVAFVVVELRVRAPIVPLDIFKSRQFSATNGVTLLIYGSRRASVRACRCPWDRSWSRLDWHSSRASMPEGTTSSRCCRLCSCSASGSRSSSHRSPPPPCHRRLPNAVDWRRRSTTPWRVPGACSRSHCCPRSQGSPATATCILRCSRPAFSMPP